MKYLFWNTYHNKDINDILSKIIIENDISMILLAECTADADDLINKMALKNVNIQEYVSCSERIKMFGRIKNINYKINRKNLRLIYCVFRHRVLWRILPTMKI